MIASFVPCENPNSFQQGTLPGKQAVEAEPHPHVFVGAPALSRSLEW